MQTYAIKPASAEEIYQGFVGQTQKILGEPTYSDIRLLRTSLYENAASVYSNRGGGNCGHLGMLMDDTTYATISPTPWVDPPEPPATPVLPPNPTGPMITEAHRVHAQAVKERQECQNVDRALTRTIIEAVEPLFLKPFHRPYIGLLGQSTKSILELLMTNYGHILPHELEGNREALSKPYDATGEPFQVLIDRFEEARTFAQDGQLPITDAQLVNSGIVVLTNTGTLDRFIDQWNDKAPADRATWLQFKTHFQPRVLAYQRGRNVETTGHGLAATRYQHLNPDSRNDMLHMDEAQTALLTMATTHTELIRQLAELQERVATLVTQKSTNTGGNGPQGKKKKKNGTQYCYTHGMCAHTGATCRNPGQGHNNEATAANPMGGNRFGLASNMTKQE